MAKKKLSTAARKSISNAQKARWAKLRAAKNGTAEPSTHQKLAAQLPWKLTVLADAGEGDHLVQATVFAERDSDLLSHLLSYMYGGTAIYEYRIEKI